MGGSHPAEASTGKQHGEPSKQHIPQASKDALITNRKHKSSLKDRLSKIARRFLLRRAQDREAQLIPTTFHCFPRLPKELQLRIIAFAVAEESGKLRTATPPPGGGPGWRCTPDEHRFLLVNHMFRQETQRLRPKAFAFFKKGSISRLNNSAVADAVNVIAQLDSNSAESSRRAECVAAMRKAQRIGREVVVPAMTTFDFDTDSLATTPYWLANTLRDFDVPDMKKVQFLLLACNREQSWSHIVPHLCRLPNLKMIGIICISLFNHAIKRVNRGKERHLTYTGPFHPREMQVKNNLEQELLDYRLLHPKVKIPRVLCMRFTRLEEGASTRTAMIYRFVRMLRDDWVIHRLER